MPNILGDKLQRATMHSRMHTPMGKMYPDWLDATIKANITMLNQMLPETTAGAMFAAMKFDGIVIIFAVSFEGTVVDTIGYPSDAFERWCESEPKVRDVLTTPDMLAPDDVITFMREWRNAIAAGIDF